MSTPYTRPLPTITAVNKPFWDAAREHRLLLPCCHACGAVWLPPAPFCPRCASENIGWRQASGRGKVTAWVIYHKVYFAGYANAIPYHVVQVDLEEGPRMVTNVVNAQNEQLHDGMPVEAVFDDVTPDITIPRFRALEL